MPKSKKPTLRIWKLPDLTPLKMTITIDPELMQMLEDYVQIYNETYGDKLKPATLIPFMIIRILSTDNGFEKARKTLNQ